MKNRIMLRVALSIGCAAGLSFALQGGQAQAPPAAQPPQSASPVQKQPQIKSPDETQAVMAMIRAQDPDSRIKAAEELLNKFADSEFKPVALQFIAASYQQKNDFPNMAVYAERALQADPKNYMAMLMLAGGIAQRTREFDLDREEKLAKAEKYAKDAMEILKTAPRPNPQITDEQWEAAKKDFNAQAYEALGLGEMARKNYTGAIEQFKKSLQFAGSQESATMVRLGAAYNRVGQYDNAISILDEVMKSPTVHPQIRQFAQAEKARAVQAKGGAGNAPAAPAAPQVEIKKQP